MEQEIIELEQICTAMYETGDANIREQAQKILVDLVNDVHVLQKCQLLFQRAVSPYSLLIAASTLIKRITKPGSSLTIHERLDIRNYVLNYLYTGTKQPSFVEDEISLLFARVTKISWFDSSKEEWYFRHVIDDISKFLQNTERCILGVQLLNQLVADMNRNDNVRPLTRHRKIAASFRDTTLFEIFQLACNMLSQALVNREQLQGSESNTLLASVLRLALGCLTFDFIGASYDESGDDLGTVQIPTGWRNTFVDLSTSQLLLNLYNVLPVNLSSAVMSCLVQTVSIRRSLFNNVERAKFLSDIVQGIKGILENPQKLSDEATFHEFCRLLARLKANYQLGELVKATGYPECMQLIANFTVTSLRMWHFSPNSIHYLLSLWQRMASSVPYVKAQEPHHLETYMPEVMKAYVESRLTSTEAIINDGLQNPLDDKEFIKQQLDQISAVARCEYASTCKLLINSFDEIATELQSRLHNNPNDHQLIILLAKLTWIIHLVGAVIGGRVSFAATDEHDSMDGQLVIRVLQLMSVTDRRLTSGNGFASIELAFLSFFEHFRKIYVGDQVQKTSKVYKRLGEVLQLNDDLAVMSVFVTKIITNLKYWSHHNDILSDTLKLLSDLSIGFSSVRKLVKLEAVRFLLEDNPSKHFPFLSNDGKTNGMNHRTDFYTSLGRLLIVDLGEDEERFARFMTPMTITFHSLKQFISTANSSDIMNPAVRTLVGVTRDCRGLALAFNNKSNYAMLFDIVYPNLSAIYEKAIKLFSSEPDVTTPILRFFVELVLNRGHRVNFDVSSPNGILLFREASKLICGYGDSILALGEPPKDKLYSHRLKGLSLCFNLLKNALSGNYVNFGVFRLYSDPALDDALNMYIKLFMAIEPNHLLEFPKLSQSFYNLIEIVMNDHMNFVVTLPPTVIYKLLESLTSGLNTLDTGVCTCCCGALDHFVSYLFRALNRPSTFMNGEIPNAITNMKHQNFAASQQDQVFIQAMRERPDVLQKALSTVLHTVMFEDCRHQWSMSRPLLALILLNDDYMPTLQKSLCEANIDHGPLNYEAMSSHFVQLMTGVEKNLHMKTRDRFTQNLAIFRRSIADMVRADIVNRPPTNESLDLSVNSSNMMT